MKKEAVVKIGDLAVIEEERDRMVGRPSRCRRWGRIANSSLGFKNPLVVARNAAHSGPDPGSRRT